jgi:N-acetylmuramoyl-L-alanine amidase
MGRRLWTRLLLSVVCALLVATSAPVALAGPPEGKGKQSGAECILFDGSVGTAQVVLDPGHGGSDSGAVNGSLIEKNLNLIVAEESARILSYDYSVALTRYDNATELGNSERGEIANACGALAFVSIHFNSLSDETVNYTKTFWGKRKKDEAFAQHMNVALWSALEHDSNGELTNLEDGGTWQFATGSLLQAEMQSALLESVFMSNPEEAQRLATVDGARLEQIAQAVADGVATWLGPPA